MLVLYVIRTTNCPHNNSRQTSWDESGSLEMLLNKVSTEGIAIILERCIKLPVSWELLNIPTDPMFAKTCTVSLKGESTLMDINIIEAFQRK